MSWWAKSVVYLLVGAIISLSACEAPKEIGLPPGALVGVKYTDTVTVRTSTVLLDSVRTSGALQMLVGRYKDPIFGQITANSYFEINPPYVPFQIKEGTTYEYDSSAILFSFSYVHGDTARAATINVHRLVDTLQNKTYYNYNTANFASKPLTTIEVVPYLSLGPAFIRKRLPDDFGKEIFELNGAEDGKTPAKFIRKVKGLTLQNTTTNTCVLGVGAGNINIVVYYHEKGQTAPLNFTMTMANRRFNYVQSNRQGTNLSTLQPLKAQGAANLKGLAYMQEALGVVTKIEFPYLSNLFKNGNIAVNRAEMTLTPEPGNVGGFMPLPQALSLIETDETNRVLRNKSDVENVLVEDGSTFKSLALPQITDYKYKYNEYNFVLSTYFHALAIDYKKNKGLLMMPINQVQWNGYIGAVGSLPASYTPYFHTGVTRMTFKPDKQNLKLVVFYTETK